MALDNSAYDSLEKAYFRIKQHLESVQLGPEHSSMIIKHEELTETLENFDIEAIEEQSQDIHFLHDKLNDIKELADSIVDVLEENQNTAPITLRVTDGLDRIFTKIQDITPKNL